jgi:hypothetical protein
MAISLHTTLRNNRADQVTSFAGTSAKLRLYTASYATLLVELICSASAFAPAASGGVLTLNAISDGVAVASGDAAVARLYKSDGTTQVMTGLTVGDSSSSAHIKLNQTGTTISSGQTVTVDSATITEGNA